MQCMRSFPSTSFPSDFRSAVRDVGTRIRRDMERFAIIGKGFRREGKEAGRVRLAVVGQLGEVSEVSRSLSGH
jgi:hypothetical protein